MQIPELRLAGSYTPVYAELEDPIDEYKYLLLKGFRYHSGLYGKFVTCDVGMLSDGATCAKDLKGSMSWWVHDALCSRGTWDDGTPITNWQASKVISYILKAEGYSFRSRTWKWATFLLGGWKIKSHGGGWV